MTAGFWPLGGAGCVVDGGFRPIAAVRSEATNSRIAAVTVGRGCNMISQFLSGNSHLIASALASPTTGYSCISDGNRDLGRCGSLQ